MTKRPGAEPVMHVDIEEVHKAIDMARTRLNVSKEKHESAGKEVEYLESEKTALEAILEYSEKSPERSRLNDLFVYDYDYQRVTIFDDSLVAEAKNRLTAVGNLLEQASDAKKMHQNLIARIEEDIELLETVAACPFRSKISEFAMANWRRP